MVINLDWRSENVDFGSSKMKSRYTSKIVTRMFLGELLSAHLGGKGLGAHLGGKGLKVC